MPTNTDITTNKLVLPSGKNNIKLPEKTTGDGFVIVRADVLIDVALPNILLELLQGHR